MLGAIALIAWQLAAAGPALATAGDLDPSFGLGGIVTTDFDDSGDFANALVIQAEGKPVAAGSTSQPHRPESTTDFGLTRYTRSGSLDGSFGTGGKVTTDFAGMTDAAHALVVQSGMLVAAGSTAIGVYGGDFALARYNPNGTLDAGFGTGGKVSTDITDNASLYSRDQANALAVQGDGKLVAAGNAVTNAKVWLSDFGLVRYRAH